jgi:uncharacterized protein YkwD
MNINKRDFKFFSFIYLLIILYSCSKSEETPITPTNEIVFGVNKVEMLTLMNNYRTSGCTCGTTIMPPVGKLIWNENLGQSAYKHTLDMSNQSYFSHTSMDGRTLEVRVNAEKYLWSAIGENIAKGSSSEIAVMNALIASPGHCSNIMNDIFTEVGFAKVGIYWTQNFGRPR